MLEQFVHWLGFGLCHQLPDRSYAAGGLQAPVCVRDTGIYVGFTIALVLISLVHRGERPGGFPRVRVWITMGIFLALMGFDGLSSYAGLRHTTNEVRLLTGLGVGFSVAALIVPMLNDELWRSGVRGRVLDPVWRFIVWIAGVPAAFVLIHYGGPRLGIAFPLAITAAILVTLTAVNLVIISMLPAFDRRAENWRDLVVPAGLALVLSFAEIALAAQVRSILVTLATRFT